MKKFVLAAVAVAGSVAVGSVVAAEQLPFEHCTWTKASGETVCRTVMPDGTVIHHDDSGAINGYQLRAAVEAEERALVWYERLDSIDDMLDIEKNPYAYEHGGIAELAPAEGEYDPFSIEDNDYLFADGYI